MQEQNPHLFSGHELKRTVRPEVEDGVGLEDLLEISVVSREAVVRGRRLGEEETHRVALRAHTNMEVTKPKDSISTKSPPKIIIPQFTWASVYDHVHIRLLLAQEQCIMSIIMLAFRQILF